LTSLPPDIKSDPRAEEANIRTTESLLFTPSSTLLELVPAISEVSLEDLVAHCLHLTAAGVVSGDEVLKNEKSGTWSGFGIDGLDGIFWDGWDGAGIIEIAGMRRVGKSVSPL